MTQHEYFAASTSDSVERERLAALEAATDPKSRRHLQTIGVGPGWKCLEVGGGGGSITRWLCETVGSSGRVVATDIDTRFLRQIDEPNVEVRTLDILRDTLEDSEFDLVHCRLLLIHLSDVDAALRRMIRAARSGGWILIEETDFSTYRAADPEHPSSEYFTQKVREIFDGIARLRLFDPYLGCRVRSFLEHAGLSDVASEGTAYIWHGGEAEAEEHRRSLPALVQAGVCSESDSLKLQTILGDPQFTFVGHTVFSAWGRRAV